MKKKIIITITILICLAILVCATIFSIFKFSVWNPFSSCFGMLQILLTNKEYTVVQNFPEKVIFSQSDYSLDEYMEKRGFYELPEKQMGAILVYSNGETEETIWVRTNAYYSKWQWNN